MAFGWRDRIHFTALSKGSQVCVCTGGSRYAGVVVRSLPDSHGRYVNTAGYARTYQPRGRAPD